MIRRLVAALRDARRELAETEEQQTYADEAAADTTARLERRARIAREEAEEQRRQRENAEYAQQRALRDLERAREWGDEYGEAKAIERLKRGW